MKKILRRDFLKYCAGSAAVLGLEISPFVTLEKALAKGEHLLINQPTYPILASYIASPYTTLDKTVTPVAPRSKPTIEPCQLLLYEANGCGLWNLDSTAYTPGGPFPYCLSMGSSAQATRPSQAAMLLTFFSMSDVHICDKESPARLIYFGALYPDVINNHRQVVGNISAYSGIILYTTHVLDAAIQTINALHQVTPFDFGIALGDACDNTQLNELRWYIDVIDGKWITPSSGAHLGETTIDYQKPYQAAGLDKSIKWYQAIGNHDQFFMGSAKVNNKIRTTLVGENVLDIGMLQNASSPGPADWYATLNSTGYYMGVMNGLTEDGLTEDGLLLNGGQQGQVSVRPVAADRNRRSLTASQWMAQFFSTTSQPVGHGFTREMVNEGFACYSFKPKASVPIKIIVIDDTDKVGCGAQSALDSKRYNWLINELEAGQAADELMIVCAHIPINPYWQKNGDPVNFPEVWAPYSEVSLEDLLETLHSYSNFVLWIAGHMHRNTITPQPNPNYPVLSGWGFWEIETPSLRDFPQQVRRFQIGRNSAGNLSIFVDSVDTAVDGSVLFTPGVTPPAAMSRSYAIGATEIFGNEVQQGPNMDSVSGVYNAECVIPMSQLTPGLQMKIANIAPCVSSFKITLASGSHYTKGIGTNSASVILNNTVSGSAPTQYMASESSSFIGASWQTYSKDPSFTLSAGSGTKTVYFKVQDGSGTQSAVVHGTIRVS
ncbi:MAG TPA: TIGR03768 family metallophosphoesterase [Syntrophobacteraceae bacterium]|nr:TIGR03768 family metallophosphoesterase [Syntrophobacteraceae bacterium]